MRIWDNSPSPHGQDLDADADGQPPGCRPGTGPSANGVTRGLFACHRMPLGASISPGRGSTTDGSRSDPPIEPDDRPLHSRFATPRFAPRAAGSEASRRCATTETAPLRTLAGPSTPRGSSAQQGISALPPDAFKTMLSRYFTLAGDTNPNRDGTFALAAGIAVSTESLGVGHETPGA